MVHTGSRGRGRFSRAVAWIGGTAALLVAATVSGCSTSVVGSVPPPTPLTAQVVSQVQHSPLGFTEGLAYGPDGQLWESDGPVGGPSVLLAEDPSSGIVYQRVDIPTLFAEGDAVVGTVIWQLTWKNGLVLEWDRATLRLLRRIPLTGARQGWGLCAAGGLLVSSDGSNTLTVRDPNTFAVRARVAVTEGRAPVNGLNALGCVAQGTPGGAVVWANVFPTNTIVRIDLRTGQVTGVLDLSALRARAAAMDPDVESDPNDVPNGIAVTRSANGQTVAWVAGKNWPTTYLVTITGD